MPQLSENERLRGIWMLQDGLVCTETLYILFNSVVILGINIVPDDNAQRYVVKTLV
jgi:hypothetical protein